MAFIPIYDTNPLRYIKRPWVAWGLIAANVLVYIFVELGISGAASDASVVVFGLIPAVFTGAEASPTPVPGLLTLITYSFLHADFWHLAGNMIFLWVLADNVEDALGHARFLVFYLLCAAAGGYAFVLSDPGGTGPVIGASGAIAGTISAYLILHPRAKMWVLAFGRIPLRLSAVYVLGFWIGFQLIALAAAAATATSPSPRMSAASPAARFSSSSCAGRACRCSTASRRRKPLPPRQCSRLSRLTIPPHRP